VIVDKVLAVIRIAVRIREFFKEYFYRWKFDEVLTETKMHSIFARHGLQSTHFGETCPRGTDAQHSLLNYDVYVYATSFQMPVLEDHDPVKCLKLGRTF